MDISEHQLWRNDATIHLPPKAFDLLLLLVQNAGCLLTKDRILDTLWPGTFVEEANLANLIRLLRKALEDSPVHPQYIQTVPKRGYRFIAVPMAAKPNRAGFDRIRFMAFPFRTGPSDSNYLAFSLPDAIAATLAELDLFAVRSTQLAMRFDSEHWDPKSVASEADVDVILTGSLTKAGQRFNATTELIDAPSATVIWSRLWQFASPELYSFHNGVVQLIVRSLTRRARVDTGCTVIADDTPLSPDAYDHYLRANQLALKRSPENMILARDLYVACTEMAPNYAPAWARLGRCYRWLDKFGPRGVSTEGCAERALERAFQLNPHLAGAHGAYTPIQCDRGEAQGAMIRLLKAAERNGNNPEIPAALVQACRYCGLLDASIAAHEIVLNMDRNWPTSVAHTYFAMGDYEKTLYWYDTKAGLYLDALTLASTGRHEEASALLWTRRDRFWAQPAAMNSLQCYLDNNFARGIAALRRELSLHPCDSDPEIRFYLARQAARFGDNDLGHTLLSQSVQWGYWCSAALLNDPWLETLRPSGQFARTLSLVQSRERAARRAFEDAGGSRILANAGRAASAGERLKYDPIAFGP